MRDAGLNADHHPLYGPVINVKMFDYRLDFDGVTAETEHLASGPVRDLEIALYPGEDGDLTIELLANAERYTPQQLAGYLQRLPLLAARFGERPGLKCGDAGLLTEDEARQIRDLNRTQVPLVPETLYSLLRRQAERTPEAVALADIHHTLTYHEMHRQVLALAQQLNDAGVRRGDIVAVALPRSVFLSLALQAIVCVGAVWLPLDTGYPDERLQFMLEDAAPALLITGSALAERFRNSAPSRPVTISRYFRNRHRISRLSHRPRRMVRI